MKIIKYFFIFFFAIIGAGAIFGKFFFVSALNGNDAQFIEQNIPAAMVAGQTYSVSVTMKNSGTSAWTTAAGYRLGSQNPQDNGTWGTGRIDLASGESVAAGQNKVFTFSVVAPSAGSYNFQWRMVQDGVEWFGGFSTNVSVLVTNKKSNTETCASDAECSSGYCQSTICCNANQCGWGAQYGDPATCTDIGGTKENNWASGICRAGATRSIWKILTSKWGCKDFFPCDVPTDACVTNSNLQGVCTPTAECSNECSPSGYRQCNGNGYQVCGNYDSDSCLEWSSATSCSASQVCDDGDCVSQNCVPKTCSYFDYNCGTASDGCGNTLNCGTCSSGYTCSNNVCNSGCSSHSGKRCADGDLYWYNSCGVKEGLAQDCGQNYSTANYRCSGNLLQREASISSCVSGACARNSAWGTVQDCSASGKTCLNSACSGGGSGGDSAAPAIMDSSPSGIVNMASTTLSVTTSEPASCRYSVYDKAYAAMTLKFSTSDQRNHSAAESLTKDGSYVYYIKCADAAGNVSQGTSKIAFEYVSSGSQGTGNAAPIISGLKTSDQVASSTIMLYVSTDKEAVCKFGPDDIDFGNMPGTFDAGADNNFSVTILLGDPGEYTYYVRCKDQAGNENKASEKISFVFAAAGPKISNVSPSGEVSSSKVDLKADTDVESVCRYDVSDIDYDSMAGNMETVDNLSHIKSVDLPGFGDYSYYIRCSDNNGVKNTISSVASFKYSEPANGGTEPENSAQECGEVKTENSDGACNSAQDCVCDPDCEASGETDPDCANAAPVKNNPLTGNMILIFAGIAAIIVGIYVIFKMRRGGEQEPVEGL